MTYEEKKAIKKAIILCDYDVFNGFDYTDLLKVLDEVPIEGMSQLANLCTDKKEDHMKNNWDSLRSELEKLGKYCDSQNGCKHCDFYKEYAGCFFGNFAPKEWADEWNDDWNEEEGE